MSRQVRWEAGNMGRQVRREGRTHGQAGLRGRQDTWACSTYIEASRTHRQAGHIFG